MCQLGRICLFRTVFLLRFHEKIMVSEMVSFFYINQMEYLGLGNHVESGTVTFALKTVKTETS